jgi:hypothetical protein
MGTYEIIRDAIQRKRQVVAYYKGYRREMCPHVIGTKGGRDHALFFQFAGESKSGLQPGGDWRCIDIDELEDVSSREGQWYTAPTHSRKQVCVDQVDAEISS